MMSIKKRLAAVALAACLALPTATPASASGDSVYARVMQSRTLRCGYIAWQPFVMKDANSKKLSGLSHDVFEALAKNMGLKIEWVQEVMVGQQIETLNTGKIDAVCGDWPLNAATAALVDYTRGYAFMPIYLYKKKGGKNFRNLEDVNKSDVSISAMDGDISLLIADGKFPRAKKVTVPSTADPTQINLNVLTNKADLVTNDPFSLSYFNAANNDQLTPVLNDRPLVTLKTGGSVKKGEVDLVRMLDGGIELMITSGEMDEILKKYDPKGKMMMPAVQPWQ